MFRRPLANSPTASLPSTDSGFVRSPFGRGVDDAENLIDLAAEFSLSQTIAFFLFLLRFLQANLLGDVRGVLHHLVGLAARRSSSEL